VCVCVGHPRPSIRARAAHLFCVLISTGIFQRFYLTFHLCSILDVSLHRHAAAQGKRRKLFLQIVDEKNTQNCAVLKQETKRPLQRLFPLKKVGVLNKRVKIQGFRLFCIT
jgi:hypothetical protein